MCRRASSAPSAAGLTALEDHDNCGSRNRGSAVACNEEPAIVMSKLWLLLRNSTCVDALARRLRCHTRI
jgi:hypothetical protein